MDWKHSVMLAIAIAGTSSVSMAQSNGAGLFTAGFVYTESNLANNTVLVFNRAADGALSLVATVPTGGAGGGVVSVGSQGALAVSSDQQYVFAVNEGGD